MPQTISAAASARQVLVKRVQAGKLLPGDRLDEASLTTELNVSRNTLREAFRLLAQDGYAVHEPHRGVFIRTIHPEQAHHVYQARRFLECGALREVAADPTLLSPSALDQALAAVERAEAASRRSRWQQVGTANSQVHDALAGVGGNSIVQRMVGDLMVDMRLLFLSLGSPASVHARYVAENRTVVELARAGEFARAAVALEAYLLAAERHLVNPT